MVLDVREATRTALEMGRTGDLVVLQCDNVDQVLEDVFAFKEACACND